MNESKIIIDSNYFLGLSLDDNTLHERCLGIAEKINQPGYKLYISHYILLEVLTILKLKKSLSVVKNMVNCLLSPEFNFINTSSKLDKQTLEFFLEEKSQKLSYIDASIIVTMRRENIGSLITFDKSLAKVAQKQGFKVLG